MEKRSLNLEIRETNVEERKIEGYASVFSDTYTEIKNRWGEKFFEKVSQGAFKKTLKKRDKDIFMLINHDWNKVVGRNNSNLKLEEDEKGLRFELTIPNTTDGNDLLENVRNGLIQGCSFGFKITEQETRWDDNWNFYRDIKEVELFEITATPLPAYKDTEINARSELSIKDLREEAQRASNQEVDNEHRNDPEAKQLNKRNANLMYKLLNAFNNKGE